MLEVKEEIVEYNEVDDRVVGYAVILEKTHGNLSTFLSKWKIAEWGAKEAISDEMLVMLMLSIMKTINSLHTEHNAFIGAIDCS